MKRGEFQLPCPVREAAGNAADQRPRPADQRADIGFELDHVAQEAMHLLRLITATAARLARRQHALDQRRQLVAARRVDDALRRKARTVRLADMVVGAVER